MLEQIFGLAGKVCLVTGAGRGLGRAAAIGLAEAGADVALLSRNRSELEDVAQAVTALGRRPFIITADLQNYKDMSAVVDQVVGELGRLDVLVNNAAALIREDVEDVEWENFDIQMAVNLKAPFELCRSAVRHMKTAGAGKIINITSVGAHLGSSHYSVYTASKAALSLFTKSYAIELARAGINIQINCIAPGSFDTHMNQTANYEDNSFLTHLWSLIPMGRSGRPDEIKGLVIFLASNASSYITGQDILIEGGWLAAGA